MARLLMIFISSAFALFVQSAWADAYKCKAPDGAIKRAYPVVTPNH